MNKTRNRSTPEWFVAMQCPCPCHRGGNKHYNKANKKIKCPGCELQ